jgi:hypothetical protein
MGKPHGETLVVACSKRLVTHLKVWRSEDVHKLGLVPRVLVTGGHLDCFDGVSTAADAVAGGRPRG